MLSKCRNFIIKNMFCYGYFMCSRLKWCNACMTTNWFYNDVNLVNIHSSEKGGFSLKQMPTLALALVMCVLTSWTQSKKSGPCKCVDPKDIPIFEVHWRFALWITVQEHLTVVILGLLQLSFLFGKNANPRLFWQEYNLMHLPKV